MLKSRIQELLPEIIKIRHTLHAHPELKYEEYATAELVALTLKKFGYEITTQIAKTGVTAILDSGKPGKTVALRADMDALPLQEETGLDYCSKNSGKMHACGHDGHTATLLAVAGALQHCKDLFQGKIKFIFQPAEENGGGAAAMIEAGILKNVDAIFGYHNYPLELGKIGIKDGCIFASGDFFKIEIRGKGAHAALPHLAINPITVGSTIVQALQDLTSSTTSATQPSVLSITEFHAGTTTNIIPNDARLSGTFRTISPENRNKIYTQFKKITEGIADSLGAKIKIELLGSFPATMNHAKETQMVNNSARELFGKNNILTLSNPVMVTEDFSYYLEKIPGCFFLVGNGNTNSSLHTSHYHFQDAIIPIAAELLAHTAMNYLKA